MVMKSNNQTKQIIIIGASGHGKEVAWLAEECGFQVKGFLDDNPELEGKSVNQHKILGNVSSALTHKSAMFIVAIGVPRIRKKIVERLNQIGEFCFATLIHPTVQMSDKVQIGEGTIICSNSILTIDITIGEHCHLNLATTVSHDSQIEDFCTLAPQALISGNVKLQQGVEIGAGASVRQGISIGSGALVGMGSVIVKDVTSNTVYVGNPGVVLKELSVF
jgi:sugar O-acyltransferase (sialic acid O-acetyltransferase NeuD family)